VKRLSLLRHYLVRPVAKVWEEFPGKYQVPDEVGTCSQN
jgi:hypothetical protein